MPVDPMPILLPGIAGVLLFVFLVGLLIVRRVTRSLLRILAASIVVIAIWWGIYFLPVSIMAIQARNGTPEEQYQVALAYLWRASYNFPDCHEAAKWMERAAQRGHAEAQRQLAWMYIDSCGVPRDTEKARYWMKKAAEQAGPQVAKDLKYIEETYPR